MMILKEKKSIFNKGPEKKHNLNQAWVIRPKLPYRKLDIKKSRSKISNYKNFKNKINRNQNNENQVWYKN